MGKGALGVVCTLVLAACGGETSTNGGSDSWVVQNDGGASVPEQEGGVAPNPCGEGYVLEGDVIDGEGKCVPLNNAPEPADDLFFIMVPHGDIPVLDNDQDADNDALEITGFTQPPTGTVTEETPGVLRYTPEGEDWQEVSFSYTVSDGTAESTARVKLKIGVDCKDIIAQQPVSVDGAYVLDPPPGPGTLSDLFPAYCLMSYDGGGWTMVGLLVRKGATGKENDFWHYSQWTKSRVTHQMLQAEPGFYNGDACGEGWSRIPGNEFLFDGDYWGWQTYRLRFDLGSFDAIRDLFAQGGQRPVQDVIQDRQFTLNHSNGRFFEKSCYYYGGPNRDVDGFTDSFLYVR